MEQVVANLLIRINFRTFVACWQHPSDQITLHILAVVKCVLIIARPPRISLAICIHLHFSKLHILYSEITILIATLCY